MRQECGPLATPQRCWRGPHRPWVASESVEDIVTWCPDSGLKVAAGRTGSGVSPESAPTLPSLLTSGSESSLFPLGLGWISDVCGGGDALGLTRLGPEKPRNLLLGLLGHAVLGGSLSGPGHLAVRNPSPLERPLVGMSIAAQQSAPGQSRARAVRTPSPSAFG